MHNYSQVSLRKIIFIMLFIFFAITFNFCLSQTSIESDSTILSKILTPEQTLQRYRIGDLQLSLDESHIAMVVTEPVKGTDQNSDIWVLEIKSKHLSQFTTSEKPDTHPRWSPDNQTLTFLSERSDKTQIYSLSMRGGEAVAFTKSETSIQSYEWSPDGKRIIYMASEPKSEEEKERKEEKDDVRIVDKDNKPSRLWIMDVDTKKTTQLSKGKWRISSYTWLPNGDKLIVSATDVNHPELETNRIFSLDIETGDLNEIAQPAKPFRNIKVSHCGKYISYVGIRVDGPMAHDLFIMDVSGGKAKNLTATSIDNPIGSYKWQKNGRIIAQVSTGFTTAFYKISLNGNANKIKSGSIPPSGSFTIAQKLTAFVGEKTTLAPELYLSRKPGKNEKITHFNKEWDSINLIEPENVHFTSFDGKRIEAALLKPKNYEEGKKVPTIILIHGGPAGRWSDRFHSWGQLLAARGYAVLYPNIRGSTGYGHDFMTLNKADWGGGDYKDLMAALDYIIEAGIADPDRVGVGGWSYGGYMGAWAPTQTHRFKASIAGAPMTDLASEYGTESAGINAYDTWYMKTPYENLDLFIERSPVNHVKNVITPTLLITGEDDKTDPIGQCQQFYRGLKRFNVETDFIIYPREGHGIREEKHQIDLLNRIVEWYEKYLK